MCDLERLDGCGVATTEWGVTEDLSEKKTPMLSEAWTKREASYVKVCESGPGRGNR